MRAIVVFLSDEVADNVARLFHSCLIINGYDVQTPPTVIDWPLAPLTSKETSP